MIINRSIKPLVFNEEDSEISVTYSNRGEPFREGVELSFQSDVWLRGGSIQVLLNYDEAKAMRDKLSEFISG